MTFRVDRFCIPNLEERLNDLKVQGIFSPRILLIVKNAFAQAVHMKDELDYTI